MSTAEKKKIFISWSGPFTGKFAMGLKEVIEKTIFPDRNVECFVSNVDIGSGEDWRKSLHYELQNCSLGIICVSNENVNAPWIFYEAGGIALREVPSTPLLIGCEIDSFAKSPLAGMQCVNFFSQAEFVKMITDINRYWDNLLPPRIASQTAKEGYDELNSSLSDTITALKQINPCFHSYSEKIHDAGTIIEKATRDIFIATAVGNKFLGKYGDLIEERLKAGVKVRYMLLDLDRFHEMEEYLHGSGKKDDEIHCSVLKKLKSWKQEYPDLVEAKFFHSYMTASYVGIDIWEDTPLEFSVFQVMMYQYRTHARRSPITYVFSQTDSKSYDTLLDSVKNMWKDTKDASDISL